MGILHLKLIITLMRCKTFTNKKSFVAKKNIYIAEHSMHQFQLITGGTGLWRSYVQ